MGIKSLTKITMIFGMEVWGLSLFYLFTSVVFFFMKSGSTKLGQRRPLTAL